MRSHAIFFCKIMLFSIVATATHGANISFDYQNQPDQFWKSHLAPQVYDICRAHGTERPHSGKYNDFFEKGTYYCACCGGDHALFSSATKFDSGTGWPSFYAPLPHAILTREDPHEKILEVMGVQITEVVCRRCNSHLGHVFDDGPQPTGKRYCINSPALVFVAAGQQPKRTYSLEQANVKNK